MVWFGLVWPADLCRDLAKLRLDKHERQIVYNLKRELDLILLLLAIETHFTSILCWLTNLLHLKLPACLLSGLSNFQLDLKAASNLEQL